MSDQEKKQEKADDEAATVSKHTFLFETPLYDAIPLESLLIEEEDEDEGKIRSFFKGNVDAYSAQNHIDTTYKVECWNVDEYYQRGFGGFYKVKLTCLRKPADILFFFVVGTNSRVVKIGQIPSLADLSFGEISEKYSKYMERDDLREFKKAIGLSAHGVGAGSFVYLRRIFEKLIYEAYTEAKANLTITEEDFKKLRMDEKVETLKDYLPSQLVDMKRIYSILSDGVHNLSEEECLNIFPALKLSIELILDQKIEADTKRQRDELAKQQIQAIEQTLKTK